MDGKYFLYFLVFGIMKNESQRKTFFIVHGKQVYLNRKYFSFLRGEKRFLNKNFTIFTSTNTPLPPPLLHHLYHGHHHHHCRHHCCCPTTTTTKHRKMFSPKNIFRKFFSFKQTKHKVRHSLSYFPYSLTNHISYTLVIL